MTRAVALGCGKIRSIVVVVYLRVQRTLRTCLFSDAVGCVLLSFAIFGCEWLDRPPPSLLVRVCLHGALSAIVCVCLLVSFRN
jgi:hypothetical protein